MICQVAIALHLTPDQVRDMELLDLHMVLQEITGRREMSGDEIAGEIARWQARVSRSNSAPTRRS